MKRQQRMHLKDAWKQGMAFFLLVFNYPLLDVFNRKTQVLGIPLMLFALFALWLLSIAAIGLFVRRLRAAEAEGALDTDEVNR